MGTAQLLGPRRDQAKRIAKPRDTTHPCV